MANINFTNHDDYKVRIDNSPGITNEKLTHLHPNRLLGVLIGRDSSKARQLACQYAKDCRDLTKRPMPIAFYDNLTKTVKPYTQEEQFNDALGLKLNKPYNREAEQQAKASLQVIKGQIQAKRNWHLQGFFAGTSYRNQYLTKSAATILCLIDEAEVAETSNYTASTLTWVETKAQVINLVVAATSAKRGRDNDDAIAFNQELLNNTFSEEERLGYCPQ